MNKTKILTVIGSIASIIALMISKDLQNFIKHSISIPIWGIIIITFILIYLLVVYRISVSKKGKPLSYDGIMLLPRGRYITNNNPEAIEIISSNEIQNTCGTISVWIYIHKVGEGIRQLENNRYIFASATDVNGPYKNVFALCHGPQKKYNPPTDPSWKIWLVNEKGEGKAWSYPDGGEFTPGWHLMIVRWDYAAQLIEFIVNKKVIISETGYIKYWPKKYQDRVFIGCWPNKAKIHFVNTYLARFTALPYWVDDKWINKEFENRPDEK